MLLTQNLLIHLQGLFQKRQRVFEVASLHVAAIRKRSVSKKDKYLLSEERQYVRVILLCNLNLGEETTVQLQSSSQVVKCLLEVTILQVGLAKLGVSCYKDEQVLLVNVHEQLA